MKKSDNELRRHRLYPRHKSDEFGHLHNEDPFFSILTPEDAEKFLLAQSREEFIAWQNQTIPALKGCCEVTLWGAETTKHSNCCSILTSDGKACYIHES